jgi:hypothetical protein
MLVVSPPSLHYPVKVLNLLVAPDDTIDRNAKIFTYNYLSSLRKTDDEGDEYEVKKTMVSDYECQTKGKVLEWKIAKDDEISRPG